MDPVPTAGTRSRSCAVSPLLQGPLSVSSDVRSHASFTLKAVLSIAPDGHAAEISWIQDSSSNRFPARPRIDAALILKTRRCRPCGF